MSKILLKNVAVPGENACVTKMDVLIENNRFKQISENISNTGLEHATIKDCSGLAILPPFYNGHCHAAMTLLRGYADDMELNKWLTQYIWPAEAKLTPKDIEIGSRLAILEMIKSGTVFFSDMYWNREQTMKVVEEMGIRAAIGVTIADALTPASVMEDSFSFLKAHTGESERVQLAVMPHAIYTVSEAVLKRCADVAREENFLLHIHLSETAGEVENSLKQYGMTPVDLMEKCGVLNDRLIAAHCVHFNDADMKKFAAAGASAVLNPCSNLKLGCGIPQVSAMLKSGIHVALGTDGASSNNNLDMGEELKVLALLAKGTAGAEALCAKEALKIATVNTARAYRIDAGEIAEGKLADAILVDLNNERMVPCHDLISNWVYSADSRSVHSVICNGKFVMENHHVDGEEDILREAEVCAKALVRK